MPSPAIAVRFVGMLSSRSAEAAVHAGISALDPRCPHVTLWDVSVRPPLPAWPAGGYAVRAEAHLADGGVVSIRSQAGELLEAVHDTFENIEKLLLQAFGARAPQPRFPTVPEPNGARC